MRLISGRLRVLELERVERPAEAAARQQLRVGADLLHAVAEAEKKRDALLERATKLLRPFGISQEVLPSLVDAWVKRRLEEEG